MIFRFRERRLLFIALLLIGSNVQSLSPEFLYNQRELSKANALANAILSNNHELEFSFSNNMKIGYTCYYLNQSVRAEQYFTRATKTASNPVDKAEAYYWKGRSLLMRNKIEPATQDFAQAINLNPKPSAELLFYYGIALYGIEKYSDALNCFTNYQAQVNEEDQPRELAIFIAAAAVAKGDDDLAEQVLNQGWEKFSSAERLKLSYLEGFNYFQSEQNAKALIVLRKLASDTFNLDIRTRAKILIGEIYRQTGEDKKAALEFDDILNNSSSQFKDQVYFRSGVTYLKLKQNTKALARFDSLVLNFPESPLAELAFYYRAKILDQTGLAVKAKADYRKFLAMYPDRALAEPISYNLSKLLYNEENYIEAIIVSEDFLAKYPKSKFRSDVLFKLAEISFELSKYDMTKKYGEQFIREFPISNKLSEAHHILAQTGIKTGDNAYAKKYYYRIGAGKYYPLALKGLADIYYESDSLVLALNYYNRAENLSQDTLLDAVRFNRELVNLKLGGYATYIDMLSKFLEKYPQSSKAAGAQYEIGRYYLVSEQYGTAVSEFDKVYNYTPGEMIIPLVEMGKGEAYTETGEKEKAVESYLIVINTFPKFKDVPRALKSLGDLYIFKQQYDSAIVYYNQLISDYDKTEEAEYGYLELAKAYRVFHRLDESVKLLERFITRYPESSLKKDAYLELADCYKESGKYNLAEKNINQLIGKFGKSGDAYFKLAEIYFVQDKYSYAKAYYLNAHAYFYKEQKNEPASLALFQAAKSAVFLDDTKEAKELFNRCINLTQDERLKIECDNQLRLIQEP